MVLQRREQGPTRILFVVWAQSVRLQRPVVVVFENVARFPISLLEALFDDIYSITSAYLEATDFGSPCSRRRLYAVMCLRRHVTLSRSLADMKCVLGSSEQATLSSGDLVFERGTGCSLSASAKRYKRAYVK